MKYTACFFVYPGKSPAPANFTPLMTYQLCSSPSQCTCMYFKYLNEFRRLFVCALIIYCLNFVVFSNNLILILTNLCF